MKRLVMLMALTLNLSAVASDLDYPCSKAALLIAKQYLEIPADSMVSMYHRSWTDYLVSHKEGDQSQCVCIRFDTHCRALSTEFLSGPACEVLKF